MVDASRSMHKRPLVETVEILTSLPERLEKALDQAVEMSIVFSQFFDLLDRVNHGRVMLPAKAASDFWQ